MRWFWEKTIKPILLWSNKLQIEKLFKLEKLKEQYKTEFKKNMHQKKGEFKWIWIKVWIQIYLIFLYSERMKTLLRSRTFWITIWTTGEWKIVSRFYVKKIPQILLKWTIRLLFFYWIGFRWIFVELASKMIYFGYEYILFWYAFKKKMPLLGVPHKTNLGDWKWKRGWYFRFSLASFLEKKTDVCLDRIVKLDSYLGRKKKKKDVK